MALVRAANLGFHRFTTAVTANLLTPPSGITYKLHSVTFVNTGTGPATVTLTHLEAGTDINVFRATVAGPGWLEWLTDHVLAEFETMKCSVAVSVGVVALDVTASGYLLHGVA